ncbi:MAG: MAPEG family protein [Myxococcales bacterium]|nr:MAG: MAPEG family protein [Myxococcales bacterium]
MAELGREYATVVWAWVVLGGMVLVQALVADVAAVRAKHTPGMPVATGHDDALFRATRAHANTLENLPAFILVSLSSLLLGASPSATGALAWAFVAARGVHMLAYYADIRALRSGAFGVGFVALIGFVVVALRAMG